MSAEACRFEIVGVAGTGKSTLARTLVERHSHCRVADWPRARRPEHWPYWAHSLPRVAPVLAEGARHRSRATWDEVKLIVYVTEWSRFLDTRPEYGSGVTIIDQGAVFALARLLWSGKPVTRTEGFQSWTRKMATRWSAHLDAVVLLEAPDATLLERINDRTQEHEAKGAPTREACDLIESHRLAYAQILELFDPPGRPSVLRFDTSSLRPGEIADELDRSLVLRAIDGSAATMQPAMGRVSHHERAV